jgi:FkbM family methyltransferase
MVPKHSLANELSALTASSSTIDRWKWIYRAWRYRLRLEPRSVRFLREHLRSGDVAIDIGAHKGAMTHWMRKCVGPSGMVYAFEPQPQLALRLQEMASTYSGDNVIVEEQCLSSRNGRALLHVPGGKLSPSATLEPPSQRTEMDDSYMVSVTTLDDYFRQGNLKGVTLIKCDVEGHELEVFRGGSRLLSVHRPHLLFECEVRHRSSGSVDEVFSYLADLGYEGVGLSGDGPIPVDEFDVRRHQADPHSKHYVNNFAFTPISRPQSNWQNRAAA